MDQDPLQAHFTEVSPKTSCSKPAGVATALVLQVPNPSPFRAALRSLSWALQRNTSLGFPALCCGWQELAASPGTAESGLWPCGCLERSRWRAPCCSWAAAWVAQL